MNSADNELSTDKIAEILGSVRQKGVRLWSENGRLHYQAPKGALSQDEIERLRSLRSQIAAFLERLTGATAVEAKIELRQRRDRAPLTFSQLAHWNLYRLSERPAVRQIASATRLRGRLNSDALQESVEETVQRHHAMRTRILLVDGVPIQENRQLMGSELELCDLHALPQEEREPEAKRLIERLILHPIDVAVDPLFGMQLAKLGDDDHILIVAMEHMISDAFSMNILLRELFTAYEQVVSGRAISLPVIPIHFADYAVWQRDSHGSWVEKHGAYWNERLSGCQQRLRFPEDQHLQSKVCFGWGTVPIRIGRDSAAQLRECSRRARTTLVMTVFAAYAGLVLRWCNASESVIQYQSDGRGSPEIQNTIGYFASVLYLRVELCAKDSFVDLMNRVTEEYCRAHEHADSSWMAAQVPRPEFTRNAAFNWVPREYTADLPCDQSEHAITCHPIRFSHPMLKKLETDNEPMMLLYDSENEIVGDLLFPLNRFSVSTMERFVHNFEVLIEALIRHPEGRVRDIRLA